MNASALFLTAFTVERYIAICHPMKAQVTIFIHKNVEQEVNFNCVKTHQIVAAVEVILAFP